MKAIIVAVDRMGGIGKDNGIPWKYSEDMKYFAATTKNSTCIMGRKTYESILPYIGNRTSLLPHRQCLVVTSNDEYEVTGATRVRSLTEGLKEASYDNVFFIGGASIYMEALGHIDTAYITTIPDDYDCDVNINNVIGYVASSFDYVSGEVSAAGLSYRVWSKNTR
jgi:dihydrofolate reductase